MADQTDITIVQGETFTMSATWTVDDVPHPLAGYIAYMQMRKRPGTFTSDPLLSASSIDPELPAQMLIEPGGLTGMVRVRLWAQTTASLTRNCWYDLFVVNGLDLTESTRLCFGKVVLSKSVSDIATLDVLTNTSDPSAGG